MKTGTIIVYGVYFFVGVGFCLWGGALLGKGICVFRPREMLFWVPLVLITVGVVMAGYYGYHLLLGL